MEKVLYFDMDNTMIPTNEVYVKANTTNAHYVKERLDLSYSIEEIMKKMDSFDMKNVKTLGFIPRRFITTWLDTYDYYVELHGKQSNDSEKEQIAKTAQAVFDTKIPVYPNTYETLQHLREKGYILHLLTLGDVGVQTKRIEDANLAPYFSDIHIVPQKDTKSLELLLQTKSHPFDSLTMIGDSLKGDIKPALEVGMKAIHVQNENWVYDHVEVDVSHPNYQAIYKIEELQEIL